MNLYIQKNECRRASDILNLFGYDSMIVRRTDLRLKNRPGQNGTMKGGGLDANQRASILYLEKEKAY